MVYKQANAVPHTLSSRPRRTNLRDPILIPGKKKNWDSTIIIAGPPIPMIIATTARMAAATPIRIKDGTVRPTGVRPLVLRSRRRPRRDGGARPNGLFVQSRLDSSQNRFLNR